MHGQNLMPRPMKRFDDLSNDPNPQLGRWEHAIVFMMLCGMVSFLMREACGWAKASRKISRMQKEIDSAIARGELEPADHSD